MVYVPVIPGDDAPEGKLVPIEIDGRAIVIYREDGNLFAIDDRCSHAGARLSGGKARNGTIMCPLHGARFNLATGHCLSKLQGFAPVAVHDIREQDGMIEVRLND